MLPCDATFIISGIILFIKQRQLKQGVITLFIMWCCWHQCWHHMTLEVSSTAPLHLLAEDDRNKMQQDLLNHLTLFTLASTSHDANAVVSSTIVYTRSRWLKEKEQDIFCGYVMPWCWCHCHMMPTGSSMTPFYLLGQDDQKEM